MSSKRSTRAKELSLINRGQAWEAYGLAVPAAHARESALARSFLGGGTLTRSMRAAYKDQRGAVVDALISKPRPETERMGFGIAQGGVQSNVSQLGAVLADSLAAQRQNEATAAINQNLNLLNMSAGGSAIAGTGAIEAGRVNLAAMQGMPGYNETYAAILAGGNAAAGIYGNLREYYGQKGTTGQPLQGNPAYGYGTQVKT